MMQRSPSFNSHGGDGNVFCLPLARRRIIAAFTGILAVMLMPPGEINVGSPRYSPNTPWLQMPSGRIIVVLVCGEFGTPCPPPGLSRLNS